MKGHFGAIALVVIGVLFLLSNLGLLHVNIGDLFKTWWPLILIGVGLATFFTPGQKK